MSTSLNVSGDFRHWKHCRPLWFRLPRLGRIFAILLSLAGSPFQVRWPFDPSRVHALLLIRDLHSTLPALVDNLLWQGIRPDHILLIDSGSTNPCCLATLATLEQRGSIWIRLSPADQRYGPYAPWMSPTLQGLLRSLRYPFLVSDPDLAFPPNMPNDWLATLFRSLNAHRFVPKVAPSLITDDITIAHREAVCAHEKALAQQGAYQVLTRLLLGQKPGAAVCTTDTTLALYRSAHFFSTFSIRLPYPYSLLHKPWYSEFCETEDFQYYQSHKLKLFGEWSSLESSRP